ncbi:MAG TPA: hypothetical protein VGM62_05530 [Chthoniobacterales bacterium]
MRKVLAFGLLLLPLCYVQAQQQEKTLADRIMEPDMTLANSAQNKKFIADRTSVNKHAHVSTFYLEQKSPGKRYDGTRDFSAKNYDARGFKHGNEAVADNLAGKQAAATSYNEGSKTAATHSVHDQNKAQPAGPYGASRPYLEQGKSQKSLNRKTRPMTIDEVRDLLNKNK